MKGANNMQNLIDKYGTAGTIEIQGIDLPIINISMMRDDKWQELARENAVNNYRRITGKYPESVEAAVKWQRERCAAMEHGERVDFL